MNRPCENEAVKSWILVLMAAASVAVSCTTGEPAPEPDAEEVASLSAQAVERACANGCQTYEIVYVQDELVKLGGSAREMPEETRSAIADLFDEIQFARGQALSDLFGDDSLRRW
jgi:hypothetical protein